MTDEELQALAQDHLLEFDQLVRPGSVLEAVRTIGDPLGVAIREQPRFRFHLLRGLVVSRREGEITNP